MMPRHRKDSGPRHRARRRQGGSRRIVVPRLPPFTPVSRRDATLAVTSASRRPRLRAARSLLATPWSAAGAGIVVAAVLAVDSPAALTYGPALPVVRCPVQGCGSAASHPPGEPATATPGVALKAPGQEIKGSATGRARRAGRAAHGTLVGYQIVRQWSSGFLAVITVPGSASSGAWSLSFSFANARVEQVWGARWQPSGNGDGVTIEGLHSWGDQNPGANQITLSVTGTPQAPSGCVLDGRTCRFGREPSAGDGQ
jgi:hypothetical protein